MPADTLDPALLEQYVADAKAAWRKHAQSLTWEQKIAAIVRMREREAALKVARASAITGASPSERLGPSDGGPHA